MPMYFDVTAELIKFKADGENCLKNGWKRKFLTLFCDSFMNWLQIEPLPICVREYI